MGRYDDNWYPSEIERHKKGVELKAQGRALMQSACDIRRDRIAKQEAMSQRRAAERAAALKKYKEEVESQRKKERDDKIRSALLSMASLVKSHGIKFDAPLLGGSRKECMTLHVGNETVKIYSKHDGFEWD